MGNPRLTTKIAGIAAVVGSALIAGAAALAATAPTTAEMLAGKKIFITTAGCGKCHTLAAANTHGTVGPNLTSLKPTMSFIVTQVTSGGRFMPPQGKAEGGSLSTTQIKDVSAFVYGAEHHLKI